MMPQAAVQRTACQIRDRRLQRIEAIVERQECVAPEWDDRCLLGFGQRRGVRGLRAGFQILDRRSLTPLRHLLRVDTKLPA